MALNIIIEGKRLDYDTALFPDDDELRDILRDVHFDPRASPAWRPRLIDLKEEAIRGWNETTTSDYAFRQAQWCAGLTNREAYRTKDGCVGIR